VTAADAERCASGGGAVAEVREGRLSIRSGVVGD